MSTITNQQMTGELLDGYLTAEHDLRDGCDAAEQLAYMRRRPVRYDERNAWDLGYHMHMLEEVQNV